MSASHLQASSSLADIPIHIVDAFTKDAFTGNPAAVCLLTLDSDIADETKQKIAAEMNLSETAFVACHDPGETFARADRFSLRWFTPSVEVDLCGHATLATATVIFRVYGNNHHQIKFETRSGTLLALQKGDSIALDFPQNPPGPLADTLRVELAALLDVCAFLGPDSVMDVAYSPSTRKLLVRLRDDISMADLTALPVNPDQLFAASRTDTVRGVIMTVKGSAATGAVDRDGEPYDFVSRYFAPWVGIAEDPVTGSSHTVLGPYWAAVLKKSTLYARQCSRRGGDLLLTVLPAGGRMEIAGHSKIVMSGQFTL
ncbi:Phenazine biosynthesis-like domain-containing protein 1 [Hypsibius exemplaris]|uniref:Phenazine biosynthesis-like domain-containing protein 1 n=1 Tax=Hypsibius exemplaris TaxID=2072580 RepID=A0A1W0X2A5_HYPEX|nr:Phenazine biosynthesis-like domain-containing protein 1 [Hypsibius exemplaris]